MSILSKQEERLIDAVCEGDLRDVHRILRQGIDANIRDENGFPALSLASVRGHTKVAVELIEHGAQIDAMDNDGNTALRWAAEEGQLETVQALLENGASIDQTNNSGYTPFDCAIENNQFKMASLLRVYEKIRTQQ